MSQDIDVELFSYDVGGLVGDWLAWHNPGIIHQDRHFPDVGKHFVPQFQNLFSVWHVASESKFIRELSEWREVCT